MKTNFPGRQAITLLGVPQGRLTTEAALPALVYFPGIARRERGALYAEEREDRPIIQSVWVETKGTAFWENLSFLMLAVAALLALGISFMLM